MRRFSLLSLALILVLAVSGLVLAQYNEAPMLAEKVANGELPPVEDRLPVADDIEVIEPVERVGVYGGTWRAMHEEPGMGNIKMKFYDPGVRWNRDYTAYIPGVFKDWEYNEDGTQVTFFLREGLKWSDGVDFTTEDLRFWWEDLATNMDYGTVPPPWWGYVDGELMTVDFIDAYTIRFNFAGANWNVPYIFASGFWNWEPLMAPKHFLTDYHPEYNSEATYEELDIARNWWQTPGHPTLFAWHTVEYVPGERVAFERNPYYWKVDTEGNQLPYIDRVESTEVTDPEVRVLKAINGEFEALFRPIPSPRDLPLLLEHAERQGYRHLDGWLNGAGGWPAFTVNQDFVLDEYVHGVLRDKNFRRGLSVAIDRDFVNDVIWYGLGTPQQATISEDSWHFDSPEGRAIYEEWAANYAQYDVALANELLDAAGLDKKNSEGFRLRADNGEVFELIVDIGDWGGAEVNQETAALLQDFWQEVGLKVVLNNAPNTEIGRRWDYGEFHIRLIHIAEMDLWTFPDWVFPTGNETRAWPMQARYINSGGREGVEPDEVVSAMYDLYRAGLKEPDINKRHQYVWDAIRIHIDEGPFFIGIAAGLPMPVLVKDYFHNVPNFGVLGPWAPGGPGNTNPEQYFIEK